MGGASFDALFLLSLSDFYILYNFWFDRSGKQNKILNSYEFNHIQLQRDSFLHKSQGSYPGIEREYMKKSSSLNRILEHSILMVRYLDLGFLNYKDVNITTFWNFQEEAELRG